MKRFIFSLFGVFLLLGGFIFVACGEELKGEIQVSSDFFVTSEDKDNYIELSLNEGDVHTATINAKVLNANDGRIKISNNYESIVQANANYNANEDQSVITLTAQSEGTAQLILNSWSSSADPVTINVYVYSDLVSLTQKENLEGQKKTQFVEIGKELELKNDRFLEMTSRKGGESNRKEITWDFNVADGTYIKLENVAEGRIDLLNATGEVVATIKDNKTLLVSEKYVGSEIALIANSRFLATEVNLEVLNTTNDGFGNFYFGRNSASVAQAITNTISIVRNNDAVEEKEAYIKFTVNTNYDFKITPYVYINGVQTDDCLAVPQEMKNGKEFVYKVSGKKGFDPSVAELKFELEYLYFDKTIESEAIKFAVSDVVDNIVVTTDEGLVPDDSNYELYQAYANGKGRWFNIQLKPDTVLPSEAKFFMEIDCPEAATQNNLSGYVKVTLNGANVEFTKNGNIWKSNPIDNNSELYIMAGSAATGNIKVRFISERAEENIRKEINFECVKAPSSITVETDAVEYLATNVYNARVYTVSVGGISTAQGLYLDFDRTLPIEESSITYEDGKIKFSITNTSLGFEKSDIKITLCHKNGMTANKEIILNAFVPLEEAKVTVDPTTLTGVSSYTLTSGSLSNLVATLGSSVKLNFNIKGVCTDLTIEDETGSLDSAWFNKTSNILFARQETTEEKTITFTFKGYDEDHQEVSQVCSFTYEVYIPVATMKANVTTADILAEDSLSVEDSVKSVQHVIINLRTDNNKVTYTDLDLFKISLGSDSVALGDKTEYVFSGESYSYSVDNIKVENNQLSFDVHAKSTNGYGITRNTLNVEYKKFNVTFRFALTLNVKNATRVSELVWENEVDSIYLDTSATDINDRNFVFITTSKPDDTYNSEIAYKFIPDNGTSASVISIRESIVSINSNLVTGGTGYIYMLPKDAIKSIQGIESVPYLSNESGKYVLKYVALNDIGNQYSALVDNNSVFLAGLNTDGSKNYVNLSKIIKKIRVVVADGQSEETAYRIYSDNQLKNINLSKHYILMNDITLKNWESLGILKGSLSGYVKESDRLAGYSSEVTITFDEGQSLFAQISNDASVKNLTFKGNVKNAFVATVNDGTIENVKVDVQLNNAQVAPSKVEGTDNAGAIAASNNGKINKAYVYGAVVKASGSLGGIVGVNSGTISNSFVEFYKFNDNNSAISGGEGSYVGGIVGLSNNGTIENTYVYDYDLSTSGISKITGGERAVIGALIGGNAENKGCTIKNSFAVVNINKYVGNKDNEDLTASIEDCYLSYYGKEALETEYKYKTTAPTSSESDNWIFEGDPNFESYVNKGNSHLKFYQSSVIDLTTLKVQSIDGKVLQVGQDSGILMRTNITAALTSLSNGEKNRLEDANRISFSDLFVGCENSNDITVTSSDTDVVDVTSNSIIIKGTTTEEITLTVYSKKDYSSSKEFKFVVINTISNFKNDITGNVLNLQVGNTASINYSIKNSIYLGTSKVYDLVQDNYEILASHENGVDKNNDSIDKGNIVFTITGFAGTVAATGKDNVGSYKLTAKLSIKGLNEIYNKEINKTFENELTLNTFKGARHIGVSNSQIVIYPSTTSSVNITLTTDNDEDDIEFKIVKSLENIDGTALKLTGSGSESGFKFIDADIEKINVLKSTTDQKYVLTVSIVERYKNKISEEETFYMIISSKSKTADNENFVVTIKLEPQDINHIDMTSYLHNEVKVEDNVTVYFRKNQISSMLSPGNFSYMVIGVDPTYSYYEYFTIGAESSEGYYLNLTKMVAKSNSLDSYTIDNSNEFSYLGNSIQVNPNKNERPEQYIFRVYASKSIKQDCIIPLTITFYGKNGEPLDTASYAYNITYQKPAEIDVNPEQNNAAILAKGSSIPVKITLGKDQTLSREDIGLSGVKSGITIGEILGPFYNVDGSKYYTTTIRAGLNAAINSEGEGLGNFQVYARVSRFVNGVKEIEETKSTITLVKFSLSSSTTDINIIKDTIEDFNLTYTFDPIEYDETETDNEIVEDLKNARAEFAAKGFYSNVNESFSINTQKGQNGEIQGIEVIERMYIEEGGNSTKVNFVNGVADCGKFKLTYDQETKKMTITGVATTDEPIRLRVVNRIYTNKYASSYNEVSCYYDISISIYTDEEDDLLSISSAEDFLNIPENSTAENYILTKDIELVNYTPIDTSKIKMLDGNGYSINVTSFNLDKGSSSIARALFSSVTSNTTLKNIRVNYYYGGQIDIDVSSRDGFNEVQIAGFAIDNSGIIYNCEVVCLPYYSSKVEYTDVNKLGLNVSLIRLNTEYILPNGTDINSTVAGFVINNTGVITNSRVGGDSVLVLSSDEQNASSESLETFNIIAQGRVSGFVSQNSGVITSSSANRVQITNKSQNINFFTSGFAGSNSGRISTSFVQGTETTTGEERTERSLCLNGTSISSNGYVAGFISSNTGEIDNSYSNIAIKGLNSDEKLSYYAAGFVYQNSGKIQFSYASCRMEGANISQSNFSGVGIKGESLNTGVIEKCYYNAKDSNLTEDVENAMQTGATLARNPSSETQFYGFSFSSELDSNDGIWYIGNGGLLTLTGPNQIAFSHRKKIETTNNGSSKFPYVSINGEDAYKYGGKKNPAIIRNAEEFDLAMGNSEAGTNLKNLVTGSYVNGVYRLVSTINLSDLKVGEEEINLSSTNKTFKGVLDGNGFTIKNIAISAKRTDNIIESVGLFSKIDNGSIYNLKLEIQNVTATNSALVGGLAGTMIGNSRLINIEVTQIVPTGTGVSANTFGVKGDNLVGGLVGAVFGEAKITNVSITDPIVQSAYYDETHSIKTDKFYDGQKVSNDSSDFSYRSVRQSLYNSENDFQKTISKLSFAGGLFGYIDTFKASLRDSFNMETVPDNGYNITNLKGNNTANIRGEIVGGLVGFVGITANVKDAGFVFTSSNESTNIISYNGAAGGVFGYTVSIIKQIYAEYDTETQNTIEDNLANYYGGSTSVERGYSEIFIDTSSWNIGAGDYIENKPEYIGGLIGYQKYGKLIASYSKINVIAGTEGCIAGGVVGRVGNSTPQSAWNENPINNDGISGTSTTVLLNEVYSSGDVRGVTSVGYEGKFTAGGLVGSVASNAKLSLTAVNSVNYFGISEYNLVDYQDASNYSLKKLGIYALVGEMEEHAELNSILTLSQMLAQQANQTEASEKHIGYVSSINYKGITVDILPYKGFDKNKTGEDYKKQKLASNLIEISPLSKITSRKTGYIEMNGYFLNSGNWSTDNWRQDLTDLYPKIKFVEILDVIYLDQYNIESTLILMKSSAKEIRVRGLTKDKTAQQPIDLTKYADYLNIDNFAGRLIGGWDADGEADLTKIDTVPIILDGKTLMFNRLGAGTVIKNLKIQYTGNETIEQTGSTFIGQEINECRFENVTFDYEEVNKIILTFAEADDNYTAGLICPSAKSTSFIKVKFILGQNQGGSKIEVKYNAKDNIKNTKFGLLAGSILQANQYRTMEITEIDVHASENTTIALAGEDSKTSDNVYVGLYAGEIGDTQAQEVTLASINLTIKDIWCDNENAITINENAITINENAKASKLLYIGGYVGKADIQNLAVKTEEDKDENLNRKTKLAINTPELKDTSAEVYVGGMFGSLVANTISGSRDSFEASIEINDIESDKVAIGGLIGELGSSTEVVNKFDLTITGDITTNIAGVIVFGEEIKKEINAKKLCIGGLVGNAKVSSQFNLQATKIGTTVEELNTINAETELYISGGIGNIQSSATTTSEEVNENSNLNINISLGNGEEFNSKIYKSDKSDESDEKEISITSSSDIYTGGMFGKVSAKNLTVGNGKIIHNENISANKSVYAGALGGDIDLTEQLELKTKTSSAEDKYTIESNIKLVIAENDAKVYVAGLVGSLSTDKLDMTSNSIKGINGNVTLSGSITNLYTGNVFGLMSVTKCEEIAHSDLTISGNIVSDATIKAAYIGALAGTATGDVKIGSNLKIENFTVGGNNVIDGKQKPINLTKDDIAESYEGKIAPLSAGKIYAGGLIGKNSATVSVDGGELTEESQIAIEATENVYFGGLIGSTEVGNVTVNTFQNRGMFALTNTPKNPTTNTTTVNNFVGGIVGEVKGVNTTSEDGKTTETVPQISISKAFVDANFFVNVNELTSGGIVGHISNANGTGITNSVFGGAFKVYGENLNAGTHTFGGIVGKEESDSSIGINNNASYGDYIITYTDTYKDGKVKTLQKLSNFTFGGIVGYRTNAEIKNNLSLTTCNNDRIATTTKADSRYAILGATSTTGTKEEGNLYSHAVTLTTDERGTDVGYNVKYESTTTSIYRGYGSANGQTVEDSLITKITKKIKDELGLVKIFNKGHKLNPITIGSTGADTTGEDYNPTPTKVESDPTLQKSTLNGVTYYTISGDLNGAAQINATAKEGAKLAIIGDARTVAFGTEQTPKTTSYINHDLAQNEFISSIRLTANIETDSGVNGGLINTMTGGTLYAVAVYGDISVGGDTAINLAPIVGGLKCGLIDESVAGANVLYRAGANNTAAAAGGGQVAGFATLANHKGESITIRNSYSTGRVSTYINATTYGFIDGSSNGNVNVSNCYTISQIDWHDYVNNQTGPSAFNFGEATYTNCWYDVNATECSDTKGGKSKITRDVAYNYSESQTGVDIGFEKENNNVVPGWEQNKDFNFGYATRKFGFLKQSSYATVSETEKADRYEQTKYIYTPKSWDKSTYGTDGFMIVPNAGKLAQISSKSDGKYVLTNDFELDKAGLQQGIAPGDFSGILDGQEYTIDYELNDDSTTKNKPLFKDLSGTVRNLRLMNVNINTSSDGVNIGSLAEKLSGGNLYNVVASGFINISSTQGSDAHDVGGIVGYSSNASSIEYCKNYVKVKSEANESRVGGIIGNASGALTLSNCINYAPIQNDGTYNNDRDCYTGGIIGKADGVNISYCGNTNSVIAGYVLSGEQSSGYVAGGIAGYVASGKVENCYNTAMVKAGNKDSTVASYAGGIVGKADGGTFSNLYNAGVIEALGTNIDSSEIEVDYISIGSTYNDKENYVKFSVSGAKDVNVYAEGIIGSLPCENIDNSNNSQKFAYKNDGQVIKNGYYKKINQESLDYKWDYYTCLSDPGEVSYSLDNGGNIEGAKIKIDNSTAKCYIQDYDDLGWVSSFSVTVNRNVTKGYNGTDYTIVGNQTIVSCSKDLPVNDTYYAKAKYNTKGDLSEDYIKNNLLGSNVDKNVNGFKEINVNNTVVGIVKDSIAFDSIVKSGYNTNKITLKEDSCDFIQTNKSILEAGGVLQVKEISIMSTNNVNQLLSFNLTRKSATEYELNYNYKGRGILSYQLSLGKPDEIRQINLKATNVEISGNDILLYLDQTQTSQMNSEKYSLIFVKGNNRSTFDNCDYDAETGKITVSGAKTALGGNISAAEIKEYYKIYYHSDYSSEYLGGSGAYTLSSRSDYITIENTKSESQSSDTYTTGGERETLARLNSEYIKYTIGDRGSALYSSDSLRKADGTKYTDEDGNVDRYLYQTGTYGDKIQFVDFPSKDGWVKDNVLTRMIMSNGNIIGRKIVGVYKSDNKTIAKFEVDCYFNSDAREEGGKIVRFQADGKVLYKIKWSQEEGSFANTVYTNSVPVYVKFVRDSTYGKLKSDGGTVEYPTFETTITSEEGATYTGTQVDQCIYDENISIGGSSYQTWHYESSIDRALTKIEKSHTFTKDKDSIAVYEVKDNYGNKVTYVDTSRNKSYTLNYAFNYSDPASNVELSFTTKEYKIDKASLNGMNLEYQISGESETVKYTGTLEVDPELVHPETTLSAEVSQVVLVLKEKNNESASPIRSNNGIITITGKEYIYLQRSYVQKDEDNIDQTIYSHTLISKSTGELIESVKETYTITEGEQTNEAERHVITVDGKDYVCDFESEGIDSSNDITRDDLNGKFIFTISVEDPSSVNNYMINITAENLVKYYEFNVEYEEFSIEIAGTNLLENFNEVKTYLESINVENEKEEGNIYTATLKPTENVDKNYSYTLKYKTVESSEYTKEIAYSETKSKVERIILNGDLNIKDKYDEPIQKTIYGNGYYLNYILQNNYLMKGLGETIKINSLYFAGALLNENSELYLVGENAEQISNARIFGSLTSCLVNGNQDAYIFSNDVSASATGYNVKSFVNYSRFKDDYDGTGGENNLINFAGIDTNYGLIVGFDGADGSKGANWKYRGHYYANAGLEGKKGQSIGKSGLKNKGILKAGNGGNGGRGADGFIGKDAYSISKDTCGTSGGKAANPGKYGDVTAQAVGVGKNIKGTMRKYKAADGNTGHHGVRYQTIKRVVNNNDDVIVSGQNGTKYTTPTFKVTFDKDIVVTSAKKVEGHLLEKGAHWVWDIYTQSGNHWRQYSIKLFKKIGGDKYQVNEPKYYKPEGEKQGIFVFFKECEVHSGSGKGYAEMYYFTTIGDAEKAGFNKDLVSLPTSY